MDYSKLPVEQQNALRAKLFQMAQQGQLTEDQFREVQGSGLFDIGGYQKLVSTNAAAGKNPPQMPPQAAAPQQRMATPDQLQNALLSGRLPMQYRGQALRAIPSLDQRGDVRQQLNDLMLSKLGAGRLPGREGMYPIGVPSSDAINYFVP